jgi:peptidoglycan-N-acetylglucosamine deacetylase
VAVSVDLDAPLDYYRFYRAAGAPPSGPFLVEALSRLGDLFGELGIRATFFAIGRDAGEPGVAAALRRLRAAGHEIANHTAEHPHAFADLDPGSMAGEIDRGREALEQAVGEAIVGFRCPAYDVCPQVLELLLDRGYRYDSSLLPSPFLLPMRWLIQAKARRWAVGLGELSHGWAPRAPRYWQRSRGRLVASSARPGGPALLELPLSVLPGWRFPFYGTLTQAYGYEFFARGLAALRRERLPINYSLHAAEIVALAPETGEATSVRVPGYARPLRERRQLLGRTLADLAKGSESVTLAELARRWGAGTLEPQDAPLGGRP